MTSSAAFETDEKALILCPFVKRGKQIDASNPRSHESQLNEVVGLVEAMNVEIDMAAIIMLNHIIPGTYIGSGTAETYAAHIEENNITIVIVNTSLSPIQQRNLEEKLKCKVIDRTALILEIFGQRAQTKEGKLQVELAAMEYQKSRLVRSWTHLERQRGGSGFMGGPGETQIESDRRQISDRIIVIKRQLKKVIQTRSLHRKAREKTPYPVVALVGYTNAGKSTLFNRLTGSAVMAEDQLFATLDPTMRVVSLPNGTEIMLSDTVGFISELPTELVAAFRATLEEVTSADLLLHIRDISHEDTKEQKQDVLNIIEDLGAHHTPMIEVYNKIDILEKEASAELLASINQSDSHIAVSAYKGTYIDRLLEVIESYITAHHQSVTITFPANDGKLYSWIHSHAHAIDIVAPEEDSPQETDSDEALYADQQTTLRIKLSPENMGRLTKLMRSYKHVSGYDAKGLKEQEDEDY